MKRLPMLITCSRIVLSVLMICAAYLGIRALFLFLYVMAILSDMADGALARRLRVAGKEGAKLDAIADEALVICAVAGFFILEPGKAPGALPFILYMAAVYAITRVIIFMRRMRIDKFPMRLYLSRLNFVILHGGMILSLGFGADIIAFLYVLAATSTLCRIEEVLIHLRYREVPYDIDTILRK